MINSIVMITGESMPALLQFGVMAGYSVIDILIPILTAHGIITPWMGVQIGMGFFQLSLATVAIMKAQQMQGKISQELRAMAMLSRQFGMYLHAYNSW